MDVIMICLGSPKDECYDGIVRLWDALMSDKFIPVIKSEVLRDEFRQKCPNVSG